MTAAMGGMDPQMPAEEPPAMDMGAEMPPPPAEEMTIEQAEDEGRGGDTVVGHLTLGEVVIPKEIAESPKVAKMLQEVFDKAELDIAQYTVGDPANSMNPETNQPEFGLGIPGLDDILDFTDDVLGWETGLSSDEIERAGREAASREGAKQKREIQKMIDDWKIRVEEERTKFIAEKELDMAKNRVQVMQAEKKFQKELFNRRKEIETFGVDRSTAEAGKSMQTSVPFNKRKWARSKSKLKMANKAKQRRPQ
jgi:hypothetical protein